MLTTFNEIDMSAVMALRTEHKEAFLRKHGIKLGFMSFFIKAAIVGLGDVPELNAEIRDRDMVYRDYYDICVAVDTGRGLVVPVIRNAEAMSFAEIEHAISDFSTRAAENRLKPDELQGGTFTISNGGVFGSLFSTPILNPPPERHPGDARDPAPGHRRRGKLEPTPHDVRRNELRPSHRGRPRRRHLPPAHQGVHRGARPADHRRLAARGGSAPRREREILLSDQGAGAPEYREYSGVSARRAGGEPSCCRGPARSAAAATQSWRKRAALVAV